MDGASSDPVDIPKREVRGFVSVASRVAMVIFGVVAAVCIVLAFELTRRERDHYIEAKRGAAEMLTELFAASIVPALDFADPEGVSASLAMLAQNREVVAATVWPVDGQAPIATLRGGGGSSAGDRNPGVRVFGDHIDLVRVVTGPTHKMLGTVLVRVSLARENAEFLRARRRILGLSAVLSCAVAALLVALIRKTIVTPLAALERAAHGLSRGQLMEVLPLRQDEIGNLGHTFNHMGRAIRERQGRITAMNARLQNLLDNMRQVIVVFDGEGKLGRERSRLARELFGDPARSQKTILDHLYPAERASDIEREAFRAWLAAVAEAPRESFDELAELAPKDVSLRGPDGADRAFELEFRCVEGEQGASRIMLLATDVTAQRRLERRVETREREHRKQIVAMRRLLAGGAQVFVRFMTSVRERLARAEATVREAGTFSPEAVEAAFRFVHTLRAEARSFDLGAVEQRSLAIELELAGVRHVPADSVMRAAAREKMLAGFRELADALDEAEALFVASSPIGPRILEQVTVSRKDVQELFQRFGERTDELGRLVGRLAARPFGEITATLGEALARWADHESKRVELVVDGGEVLVPAPLCDRLRGVLAHLLRNAVAHGIEAPGRRAELGKPASGRVELRCRQAADGVVVEVSDDGAGFDVDGLRRAHGASSTSDGLEIAFQDGLSTRAGRDELAGHGVGLGAVRDELRQVGYSARLSSTREKGAVVRIEAARPRTSEVPWPISP